MCLEHILNTLFDVRQSCGTLAVGSHFPFGGVKEVLLVLITNINCHFVCHYGGLTSMN